MPERTSKRAARGARSTARASQAPTGPTKNRKSPKLQPPKSKSGVPITDELADRLAEEAESGYDLTLGRRVGRKSLAGGSGQSPRLNFRTTHDLYERASARAEREGKTVSQLAREALERYVKHSN
jgi:hypothetical protein